LKYFSISGLFKFGGVGAFVTIASMISSFFWLKVVGTPLYITYFFNYSFFILVSYTLNRRITFNSRFSFRSLILYYLVYLTGMLLGILLLYLFKNLITCENWVYYFMVVPFTLVNNYVWSSIVFHKKGAKE